jgi:lysophospholipase L1-like esterase
MKHHSLFLLLLLLFFSTTSVLAQDPTRFASQIEQIREQYPAEENQGVVVFTGSSSIRLWQDLSLDFPTHRLVNTGFGGSQASDLLHYLQEAVLAYSPSKVFIYEGDNDISAKKGTEEIMGTLQEIVDRIHGRFPGTEVVLISAKPSIARWNLASSYKDLNAGMKRYAKTTKGVSYADVWKPMLNKDGKPLPGIFVEDNLHMNRAGYEIWAGVIGKFMK